MNVLLLSRYGRLGSSSRVRMYQYLPYLKANGVSCMVAPLLSNTYVEDLYEGNPQNLGAILLSYLKRIGSLFKCGQFDLIWLERELLPWWPAWAEAILDRLNIPYVVDFDDAVFHRYDLHSSKMIRFLLGEKIGAVMRHASVVVVGNGHLSNRAKLAGAKRIECLPSVVDLTRYQTISSPLDRGFTIGWIGTPNTTPYLRLIRPALEEFRKNKDDVQLSLIGSGELDLGRIPVKTRKWSEETEVAEIQQFDVGIMPIPDEPFERGKSGYKLIQYMACGIPVIASPVGANREIVEEGVNGYLAERNADWADALFRLEGDPALRKRMGAAGRKKVEQCYSLEVTTPRLLALLKDVAKR